MSRLIVADLADGIVGGVGEAGDCEGGGVEALDALLVEGEDDPFGGEEVLEEEVVSAKGASGCGEDGAGCVAGPGGLNAGLGGVDGRFAWDGAAVGV